MPNSQVPRLVRLYIRQVLIGFVLSGVFVALLLWANVGNLWHLISTSDMGIVAGIMLFMFNGIIFSGVQFAISIMRMEEKDDTTTGGTRVPVATDIPVRVEVTPNSRPRQGHVNRGHMHRR